MLIKQHDVQIIPNGLLFQKSLINCEGIIKTEDENIRLFLKADGKEDAYFDMFAASFFLIARYEEYMHYVPDKHGRFEASSSLLFQNNLLDRPLVNEWSAALKKQILDRHPDLPYKSYQFTYKISIDIDQAFAFKHRGIFKNSLALAKNITTCNTAFIKSRMKTLLYGEKDPYNTFDYLMQFQKEFSLPFIYFVNAGKETNFDKNICVSNYNLKKILKDLSLQAEIGLHPSYYSDNFPDKIKAEKKALETVLEQEVTQSRQHYLKLKLPQTYRNLIAYGIREDYSMGFASYPGFRAGTCLPFYWFDLEKNAPTPLRIFPVTYMEGSFAESLKLSPEKTMLWMEKLTKTVKLYNGHHICIWHNHTVNNTFFWKGWKAVFEASIYNIIKQSN